MRQTIIQQSPNFILTSYANGLAYKLENTGAGMSVFVQGDDAAQFREELESFETHNPEGDDAAQFREELESFETHNPEGDGLAYLWTIYDIVAQED